MTSVKEQLEADAAAWVAQGRGGAGLLDSWKTLHAQCWLLSDGAKHDGCSADVTDFVGACRAAMNPGWDAILSRRENCSGCYTRFRIENLSVCRCGGVYCYHCVGDLGAHANGNRCCSCGGEVVG
ncbi:MAG: hypothetical protein KME26_10045 [Oscillatoria princeps RMCB-10]|jgi:hypothetical protein|nr:hypothetical protein [Oscillatoria princeps RMCB-10]